MSDDVPLREWIRTERLARGWSVMAFAQAISHAADEMGSVPPRDPLSVTRLIYRWEGGKSVISDRSLALVIRAFAEAPVTGQDPPAAG
jgi:hypothetical protein